MEDLYVGDNPPRQTSGVLEETFFSKLEHIFNASDYQPRWKAENWRNSDGELLVASNIAIAAVFAIATILAIYCFLGCRGKPHRGLFNLLVVTLLGCAIASGLEAAMFWWPAYRFAAWIKILCAGTGLFTLVALVPVLSKVLKLRSATELELEIAQRRMAEQNLRRVHSQLEGVIQLRTAQLAAKNEEMEQFLNAVTHDLKSPVTTCTGLTGLLREDIKARRFDELTDSVDRMDRSIARMRRLIENLLQLSRAGSVPLRIALVDPLQLVKSIIDDLELRIRAAGVKVIIQDQLPACLADENWLAEIFENLINNAVKYGCDNSNPTITIGAETEEKVCKFYVRDNGRGIDPAHHEKILQPFCRLRADKEGTGIGLAIVQKIVKMHGGRIWIESRPEHGACFWFSMSMADSPALPATVGQTVSISERM